MVLEGYNKLNSPCSIGIQENTIENTIKKSIIVGFVFIRYLRSIFIENN